ncbi:uncharacterized protein LOC141588507 [Silene latifolia]|uniref:uncharacterized protein LOC141588507 n=1 Tax=Silene latifolia TaxID=37657 RepID=UPI003D781A7E
MDLQKVYDTVEWNFFKSNAYSYGFPTSVHYLDYAMCINNQLFFEYKWEHVWLLNFSTDSPDFHIHPLCKAMKLTHLMFTDDLLLFSKGDAQSMMTLLKSFSTFSKTSGLKMSKGKSNAYFNGVPTGLRNNILQISGMVEGSLPFRYLGVPIKTTKCK